tara:strand:+ start:693 stop:1898 length:1206 start_codon:yes stop_codon:yes gene_type:complete
MDTITYPNENFNFDNISLGQPTVIQGGSYFTKISSNSNILYLQTPSCYTKQGIVLSGKKAYCDLMYTSDDYDILTWFERLVERLQQLIYDKRKLWFHNEMEMEDIDSAFTPPVRIYKSGKFHLVRTYIQGLHSNNPLQGFSCYDENEEKVDPEILNTENKKIIPLLEIKGIKFSSKSFHFDISLKQAMVIEENNFLNNCLIKLNAQVKKAANSESTHTADKITLELNKDKETEDEETEDEQTIDNTVISDSLENEEGEHDDNTKEEVVENSLQNNTEQSDNSESKIENEANEAINENNHLVDNTDAPPLLNLGLEEIDINTNDIEDMNSNSINIKSANEAYIELWNAAREKARQARKAAILAHLDARKIRAENMLDNLDEDSDEEEFDAYVESLENLDLEN